MKIKGLIRLPFVESDCSCNGHIFYIITKNLEERARLMEYFKKNGILAIFHYIPLHSSPAGLKYGRVNGSLQVTDDLSNRLLRLPIYYEMGEEEVNRVAELMMKFYSSNVTI